MNLLKIAGAAVALALAAPASAGEAINCQMLARSPYICVHNASKSDLTVVGCVGFWGETDQSIPNGQIGVGETMVLKLDGSKCNKEIVVRDAAGRTHSYKGFNVDTLTTLEVKDTQ